MSEYYDELLKLCGFEIEEIKEERPRIEKCFTRLGIGTVETATAVNWVRQNHDVSLKGVRMLLGAWLKELIDLVLARDEGKKIIYFGFPAIQGPGLVISASADNINVCAPDMILCHTLGQIFNRVTPLVEAGEANGLPPGHALCSLWQVKVGALAKGIIPVPDLALASSYFCDMGSKADDYVAAKFGVPIAYIDGVMDSKWGEYPNFLPERVDYLGAQINQALEMAEEVLGIKITPAAWEKSRESGKAFVKNLSDLLELMKADPVPVSVVELELLEPLTGSSTGRGIEQGIKAMEILVDELRERVKAGKGVTEKGAPRVMILQGHAADPTVTRLIESCGLAVPLTVILAGGAKMETGPGPRQPNYTAPADMLAYDQMSKGGYHGTDAAVKRLGTSAQIMKLDGFIINYLYHCRPVSLFSCVTKKYLEEKTGLPALDLEFDLADNRIYGAASLRTRVETFAHILKAQKA
ncbi:MAG: 2-hydroxyacyl-CoA dehydratase [Dehalococcoidales bacterium]|nr:2-hydroxyacyl-CoA dehydratase [Dehalococcoidales bacterium]